jgi:mRNA interferase RelE/StbE
VTYQVLLAPPARRALTTGLPPSVAAAVMEFLAGPLTANPHRVGKPLRNELAGKWSARRGEYRVVYLIDATTTTVTVLTVAHRRDVYRRP